VVGDIERDVDISQICRSNKDCLELGFDSECNAKKSAREIQEIRS
jgi:hypothetical protein